MLLKKMDLIILPDLRFKRGNHWRWCSNCSRGSGYQKCSTTVFVWRCPC